MIESPNSESHSRRKWEWQRIFIAAVFLFTLVASNWIYSIGSIGPDSSSKRVTGDEVSQIDTEMDLSDKIAWVGGWPYKYFLRVENDGVAPLWVWSSFRFFLNILIWSIAAGVISVYFLWTRRQRDAESISQRPRMGQVGLADLLILMRRFVSSPIRCSILGSVRNFVRRNSHLRLQILLNFRRKSTSTTYLKKAVNGG